MLSVESWFCRKKKQLETSSNVVVLEIDYYTVRRGKRLQVVLSFFCSYTDSILQEGTKDTIRDSKKHDATN